MAACREVELLWFEAEVFLAASRSCWLSWGVPVAKKQKCVCVCVYGYIYIYKLSSFSPQFPQGVFTTGHRSACWLSLCGGYLHYSVFFSISFSCKDIKRLLVSFMYLQSLLQPKSR